MKNFKYTFLSITLPIESKDMHLSEKRRKMSSPHSLDRSLEHDDPSPALCVFWPLTLPLIVFMAHDNKNCTIIMPNSYAFIHFLLDIHMF